MRIKLRKDKVLDGSFWPVGSEITLADDAAQKMIDANEALPCPILPQFVEESSLHLNDEAPQAKKKRTEK